MNPPIVYEVRRPKPHKTAKTIATVSKIFSPLFWQPTCAVPKRDVAIVGPTRIDWSPIDIPCGGNQTEVPVLQFNWGGESMRVDDLHHSELLELDPDGGTIHFAGQRALLIDAVAMGLLRKYLVENFGLTAARTVLTQFGFAHGWRLAEAMEAEFKWSSDEDRRCAGIRIHALGGLFHVEPGSKGPLAKGGVMLLSSYEPEQHLLHFGRADVPVCWTICGLISGYISRSEGKEIYVLEDRCLGSGHAACHLFGRTREEWGDARAEELRFFEPTRLKACLDVSLRRVTETLKASERKLREYRRAVTRIAPDADDPLGIVTKSPAMRQVVDLTRRVAKVDSTVLITGESGSGKERIAQLIHQESTRAAGPFIAVNCGAITESLLESELFGHARGAFTGATQDRPGLFEAAHTGTLLLDEVGDISPGMQVKLLRALQEREVRRVGENKSRKVDVRLLAATNRDLANGIAGGDFRQDLYYRLKVVELRVPPLRERRDDILPLARVLLTAAARQMKRKISSLAPNVADQLLRYEWPGNVRELENTMERGVALARGSRVELEDLPEEIRQAFPRPVESKESVRPLDQVEKDYILAALNLNGGNQTHTAEQLQIGSATLYRKLKDYGLIGKKKAEGRRTQSPEAS
jgi:two-component system, NtrC family, response regulator HydG